MAAARRIGNLAPKQTVMFCCDMQERFRQAMLHFDDIITCASRLVAGSKILGVPLIVTEQYPKGLGNTILELDINHAAGVFPKTKFSMVIPEVEEKLLSLCDGNVKHVILFGIEAHVCVQQTVLDLLERDYEVHVVADACTSRSQMDRQFAYDRFRSIGATVTTREAVLFQLVQDKNHEKFKEIQGLIKSNAPTSGLVKL